MSSFRKTQAPARQARREARFPQFSRSTYICLAALTLIAITLAVVTYRHTHPSPLYRLRHVKARVHLDPNNHYVFQGDDGYTYYYMDSPSAKPTPNSPDYVTPQSPANSGKAVPPGGSWVRAAAPSTHEELAQEQQEDQQAQEQAQTMEVDATEDDPEASSGSAGNSSSDASSSPSESEAGDADAGDSGGGGGDADD